MHYGSTVGVLTSFTSALAAAYFCFPPKFGFFISDPLNVAELGFFLMLAMIASKAVAVVTKDERVTRRPKRWNPSFRAISSVARIISSAHAFLGPAGRDCEGPHRPGGDGGRISPTSWCDVMPCRKFVSGILRIGVTVWPLAVANAVDLELSLTCSNPPRPRASPLVLPGSSTWANAVSGPNGRASQSVPLQYLIIERHQHCELGERCLPKVLV